MEKTIEVIACSTIINNRIAQEDLPQKVKKDKRNRKDVIKTGLRIDTIVY